MHGLVRGARPAFKRASVQTYSLPCHNVAWLSASTKNQPESVDKAVERAKEKLQALNVPSLARFVRIESKKIAKRALVSRIPDTFPRFIDTVNQPTFNRLLPEVLQVNIGLTCNQTCHHCHVDSSPTRTEQMDERTADRLLQLIRDSPSIKVLDLTGGAPELIRVFKRIVEGAREIRPDPSDLTIIVRCNLTVIFEENVPGFVHPLATVEQSNNTNDDNNDNNDDDQQSEIVTELVPNTELLEFYVRNQVKIIASLPCYSEANVDKQRGKGVFEKSIEGLQALNQYGYGVEGTGLELDLVYNPLGPSLPPPRDELEVEYKERLFSDFGITFSMLHTFNNQPIKRFVDYLLKEGQLVQYMQLLLDNFNPSAVDSVMCKNTINVGWTGHLYDCDFNQVLEMPMRIELKKNGIIDDDNNDELKEMIDNDNNISDMDGPDFSGVDGPTIWDIDSASDLIDQPIETCLHCYACTAGCGSKCGT